MIKQNTKLRLAAFILVSLLAAPQWLQAQGPWLKLFNEGRLHYKVTSLSPFEV